MAQRVERWTCDQILLGAKLLNKQPWTSCSYLCASGTKQYNLVPAKGRWRSAAGKVTAGLAESNDSLPPGWWLTPGPHQQQCRSNVRLCCEKRQQCRTSFALKFCPFDKSRTLLQQCCFDIVAFFGNKVERNFVFFDNVETNWTCSICLDFVKKDEILQ